MALTESSMSVSKRSIFGMSRPKEMRTEGDISSLVIQGLRYLGKDEVRPDVIARLRSRLSPAEKRRLLRDSQYSADWIFAVAPSCRGGLLMDKVATLDADAHADLFRETSSRTGLSDAGMWSDESTGGA